MNKASMEWPHVGKHSTDNPLPRRGNAFTRLMCKTILRLSGFKMVGELPKVPRLVAVMGPHTSNWDFVHALSVQYALGVKFSFMIKHTVFVPVAGSIIKFFGGIPTDRKKAGGLTASIIENFNAAEKLVLVITPEGTRSGKTKLKTGFHRIAQAANVPVLMASVDYGKGLITLAETLPPTMSVEEMVEKMDAFYAPVKGRCGYWMDRDPAISPATDTK